MLLQVHGGGWTIGNKDTQGIPLMMHLAARGWVCVAINYRLSPRDPFPGPDRRREAGDRLGARAHRRARRHPGLPGRHRWVGRGHLAALAALTQNDPEYQPGFEDADTTVQAAVPFYGVYDLAGSIGTAGGPDARPLPRPAGAVRGPGAGPRPFEKASPLLRVRPTRLPCS